MSDQTLIESQPETGDSVERLREISLARALLPALNDVQRQVREGKRPTVRDLLAPLGENALALSSLLICLPFLWPLTLGPLTGVVIIVLLHVGFQIAIGREQLVLPDKVLNKRLPRGLLRLLRRSVGWLTLIRHWDRSIRQIALMPRRFTVRAGGIGIVIGACLLALPMVMIPFSNTLPALGIMCCAVAIIKRNDLFFLWALLSYAATVLLFIGVVMLAIWGGSELMEAIEERSESDQPVEVEEYDPAHPEAGSYDLEPGESVSTEPAT